MAFSENDIARRRTELQHAPNSDHFKYQKPDVTAPARHGSIDSPTRSTGGSTTGKASGGYTEESIARRRSDLQHGGSDKFAYQRPDFSGFSAPKPASSPIYSPDGAFFPKKNPYEGTTTRRPNPFENVPYSDPLTRAFSQQTGWRDPKAQALYELAERVQAQKDQSNRKNFAANDPIGQMGRGNIDLYNRPQYRQPDGSLSTVNSISIGTDEGEVLIPTIGRDAKGNPVQWTDDEAIENYFRTGQYLGKFKTPEEADRYAEALHNQQEAYYSTPQQPKITPASTFRSGPLADIGTGPRSRSAEAERQASEAARDALDQAAAGVRFNRTEAEKRRRSNAISFPETETADDEYSRKMEQRPEWLGGRSVGEYMRDFMNSQEALGTYGADVVREYNRIYDSQGAGAAQKYVMSKDSTGNPGMERIDAFLTGVGNASGINSIAGIAMGPENYRRVASEQQSISEAHPIASAAGAITGTLPLITTLGRFARAIPAVAGLSKAAQAVISGAAAMGGSTAIQEAGAVANGLISPGKYAGDVAVSGLAGIAGGALGNTVSQKGMQFLYDSGLINNSIARTVVAGLSGSGYSVGSTGVREASAFIRDPENYEADPVRIIKDASVAFAFGAISYIANGGTRFTMNEEASNERPKSKWFEDCSTPQEVDAKLRQYARQYHPDQSTGDADLFSEISAEATAMKTWMNVNNGAHAYQKAQEAYASGDTAKYQEAQQEYNAAVNALMVDVQSGAIQGQEAVEALQVLQSVSSNLAGPETQAPATPESDALAALAEQGFPSTVPTTEARLLSTGTENVQVPQNAVATSQQDIPGNPYERTAAQKLDTAARHLQALEYERSQHPSVEQLNDELNSPFAVFENKNPEIAQIQTRTGEQKLAALAAQATANQAEQKNAQIRAIYEAGRTQNPDFQSIMDGATMLTEAEKTNAFYRGLTAAAAEAAGIGKEISYGGQQQEEGNYLSGEGSGRPVSLSAGESVGGVRTQAGRAPQGWKDWSHSADSGIKRANVQISGGVPAEKIIRTAEPGQVIYKVESGHTPSMRKAAAMVRTYDPKVELVPFVSGNDIRVTSGETARAFVDPERRSIGYRANDERAAGDQLARHELIELGVIDGKVDLNDALKHLSSGIREFVDDDIISDIADVYLKSAVNDVGSLSPEALSKAIQHASKEMLCDIGAGINQFDGVDGFELYAQVVDVAHDILHDYMNEKLGGAFDAEPESIPETKSVGASQADVGTALTVLKNTGISVNDNGTVAHMEYSTRYSWKTREEQEKAAAALQKTLGVSKKKALGFIQSEMSLTNMILRPGNVALMDYTPDDRYTALKKNSDYPQGTFDFNNNCRKRVPFTTLFDRIQMRNPNRLFTADDLEIIRQNMIKHNYPVACALCYVEERRQKLGEIADSFVKLYENDAVLDRFVGKTPFEKMKAALESVGDDPYKPTIADLVTYEGLKKLEKNHKGIADAFRIFNNARGMQSGRLVEGRAEYKRELLTYTPAQVKRVNDLGGIRVFSYSDFEAVNLLDLVQIIQDAASKGIMIQAYTKVPAFAKVVRNTGIKLNRSLIAAGTGVKYENGKKVLDLDPVEGININDPDFFDSTDDRDVGNILVGMSDEQIRLAMASPFVDYIIPFHTSLPGTILKAKKIDHWKNYKLSQTDKDMKTGKNAKNINIYTEVLQAAAKEGNPIKNKKDFVNKFLQVAKDKNLIPRFSEFLNTDKDGNFVYTEGYHKFLIDFKLFDKNGNIVEQKPVRPVFDDAYNTKLMEDFANGVGSVSITDELYRDTVDALNAKSEGNKIQYSSKLNLSGKQGASGQRDSSGKTLTAQQAEYFKDSKIRDEDGNLLVVYHGTSEDFNVFDSSKGRANMDIQGSFFSPWDIDAKGYGPNVKTVYLNIKNPAPEGIAYKALNMFKGQNNAGVKAREYLIRRGYDGVNNGNEEYIAFYPEQIKNIDNENPTENADIRYSSKLQLQKKRDEDYSAAIRENDMETAGKLVEQAAGEAGYHVVGYHGTDAHFNEFKFGDLGYHIGTEGQAKARINDTGLRSTQENRNPHILKLYARINNPLMVGMDFGDWHGKNVAGMLVETEQFDTYEYEDRLDEINSRLLEIAAMPDGPYTDKVLREYLQSLGYDGVEYENQFEDAEDDFGARYGDTSYIAFESNQLKLADPIVYDDAGNIVPLSERFNPENEDIRFSTKLNLNGREVELTEREEKLMEQLSNSYLERIEQVTAQKDAQIAELKEQMKAAVGAEKEKARQRIEKLRQEKNNRIAYLEKQWRKNTDWRIAELKRKAEAKRGEEHDDMIRRLANLQAQKDKKIDEILAAHRAQKQAARDKRNDRKLRVKFQKLAQKALRESRNKPGLASERVQELLKDIDLTALGMRDDTRTSLHNKLLEIMEMRKTDENYLALHAEQDWKKVERLFKKQIKDMSLEEVNDLITELSALCHYQETTDRLIKDEQNRTAAEVGRQIVKDLKELTPLDITNPVKVLSAKYLRDNLSPDRAFNRLSGYKRDSAMRSLYRQVLDGYTKVKEFEKKSDELFDSFRNDPKNKEFLKNGAKQTIPVTSKYGQTALISPAMRVSLYMASRNRDNLRHISTDGMTVPEPKAYAKGLIEDAYGRGTTIVLDPVDVNKVCANMTESEKEFASLLETFFDGYAKEAINDTSVELDGILKAIVDHYFPIASDKNFLAKSMDSFQDPTLEGWNNLKARQEGANNKILLEDARQVLQRHIRNTARYYGLAIPMRNWNKVYGYTSHRDEDTGTRNSVQSAIKNAWNSDTADYIERLIRDDINSGGRKAERGVMDSMRSAYAGATLTLNAGVALKQTTSYFMAGSILDMESLMYGLSHKFKKTDQEYMDSITPWGWARRQGESTIELGEMARRRDPITRNTPNWNQAMDVLTTNALFTAAERSIQKDYPGLKRGDKKYDDALAERYNQVLWRTQPQYESAFRPEYLRKTDIGSRTFGMFRTESMQMSGELIDAWGQWKADEKRAKSGGEQEKRWKSESSKRFYKTFASWLASNMCFAMMGTALDIVMFHKGKPYRNERGEVDWQTIAAKTGVNFVGSALGGYFFASTAFSLGSYLFNIISGEKATWYDIEVPGISLINDMVTNTGNWVGTMIDEEASPSAKAKATSKFVLSASKFTPLGFAGNLLKLADSLNLYIQDIREGIKTGDWHLYEAGDGFLQDTSPTKDQYANQAVYYAGQGNIERAGRALKKTKTGNLEKALGRKIGDVMFSRFVENPQDLVSYMETIAKNGGTPKLSDVPDRGFSSFTKLKEGLGSPNRNENWHHIVEQQQGPGDNNFGKFSSTQINNANNVISIPSGAGSVHKAITDYYTSVQDFTDGMTVREWLAENKTFEEQFDFGIEQLRKYGEVAPTERGWIFIPDEEKINAIPLKEGKDKELTATQKQWDTMMAEAREDGGLTDREIRAAALQMLNEGVPKDEVIELYKSKKNDKYIDEWMKYDGESGGDLSVYFGFMNAKSLGNQDGAAEYLNESGLPDDDKWALWELAGWSEASYDKKVE